MQVLCENCGHRPATVHQTVIMNGVKQESHLCEVCAREKGQEAGTGFSFPNLSIQQLLSSFLGQEMLGAGSTPRAKAEPHCQKCGMTYSEFANGGLLGCSQCYEQLEPYLVPLIKRIQGTTTHSGKAPKRTGGLVRKRRDLEALKQQLHIAIQQEQYEEAARIRDRVREMEAELQAGGGNVAVE